jgi:two-component system, cell cycle response regulator
MTGVVLVVDDIPANVKLLEAKLSNEYYDVVTAKDGYEALQQAEKHKPDLILLDVMMPGMDGFETCRKIKENPEIAHIPVVMVTALSEMTDRLNGLEAGADDFITKPINDTALFARVKSLVRIKVLIDELRLRDQSGAQMGIINDIVQGGLDVSGSLILIVDDDAVQSRRIADGLQDQHQVHAYTDYQEALANAKEHAPDLILISTMLTDIDGLRLATQFKAIESLRNVPIITLVDEDDTQLMLKALELGVNDYLVCPVDNGEMNARIRTQLRRKKYQDSLKSNYKESVSLAITDALTGLYNRHYLDTHLKNLTQASLENGKPMSTIIMDMDHFKSVNDTYGHDVGDEVLKCLAQLIIDATRSSDLVARFGGEEFVVLMPETDFQSAYDVADRIRQTIEQLPMKVSHEVGHLSKTVSIGVATLNHAGDTAEAMLKRADNALYAAKHGGRNQVQPKTIAEAKGEGAPSAPPTAPPATPTATSPIMPPAEANAVAPAPLASSTLQPVPQPIAPQPMPQPVPQPTPAIAPMAAATLTPQPVAQTIIPQPVIPQPVLQPIAPQPVPAQPAMSPPIAPQPVAPQPIAPQSIIPQPITPQPVPQPTAYNPSLAAQATPQVQAVGQGPNVIQPMTGDSSIMSQLKPKAVAARPAHDRSFKSPIDDEPPGTF